MKIPGTPLQSIIVSCKMPTPPQGNSAEENKLSTPLQKLFFKGHVKY